jgi:hypothetical protein
MGLVVFSRGDIAPIPGVEVRTIVEGHVVFNSFLLGFRKTVYIEGWRLWSLRIVPVISIADNAATNIIITA